VRLATKGFLETDAPDGLYRVWDEPQQIRTVFDIVRGEETRGPMRLIARVREPGELPHGVESITIRPDGRQVIYGWEPA
jgi:hypothetical protein